eukprot:1867397-Amphidinium_carterae.3
MFGVLSRAECNIRVANHTRATRLSVGRRESAASVRALTLCLYCYGDEFKRQKSFISRRVQMWLARLSRLGLDDLVVVRQTYRGRQVGRALGHTLQYVRSTGVVGLSTDECRPLLLMQQLFQAMLTGKTLSFRASPHALTITDVLSEWKSCLPAVTLMQRHY